MIKTQVLRYYGSKGRLAPFIISHFPKHEAYIEPFCGGASVFFQKEPSRVEVLNDMNGDLINFFRVCRDRPGELSRAIWLTPYSRLEFDNVWKETPCDDVERARRLAVKAWQSYGHRVSQNDGWNKMFKFGGGWDYLPDIVLQAAARLREARIENKDALEILDLYSKPQKREVQTRVFYVDPPYAEEALLSRHRYGKYNINHEALLLKLLENPFYVLISGYDSELYNDLLKDWFRVEKDKLDHGRNLVKEVLWMNPQTYEQIRSEK